MSTFYKQIPVKEVVEELKDGVFDIYFESGNRGLTNLEYHQFDLRKIHNYKWFVRLGDE